MPLGAMTAEQLMEALTPLMPPVKAVARPRLLTQAQLAEAVQISPPTLREHVRLGAPTVLVESTGKVMYDLEDYVTWLKERSNGRPQSCA
jgi:hypothetical protein